MVLSAERMPDSEKLVKLQIDLAEKNGAGEPMPRQILAGIGKAYTPEELIGKQIVVITNLDPRKLMGEESRGMVLAAHGEEGSAVILMPEKLVPPGSIIS